MNFKQIQQLIKFVARTGVSEVNIENSNIKINIKGNTNDSDQAQIVQQPVVSQIQPVQAVPVVQPPVTQEPQQVDSVKASELNDDSNYLTIKSPIIGTFYRKPSPDKDNFVEIGDQISEGQTLCVIEAMKLFNEIESDISGKVVKVLVDDATPVEFDQPLFLVEP
jgi:acetyl-CoA carboxylase biotin carboxyl carrier protein